MDLSAEAPAPSAAVEGLALEAESAPAAVPAPIDASPVLATEVAAEEPAMEGSMPSAESDSTPEMRAAAVEADPAEVGAKA